MTNTSSALISRLYLNENAHGIRVCSEVPYFHGFWLGSVRERFEVGRSKHIPDVSSIVAPPGVGNRLQDRLATIILIFEKLEHDILVAIDSYF